MRVLQVEGGCLPVRHDVAQTSDVSLLTVRTSVLLSQGVVVGTYKSSTSITSPYHNARSHSLDPRTR